MNFGSDNQTGASTTVLELLIRANEGTSGAYGDDPWCAKAIGHIQELFETDAEVFFVSTGTAANCLALANLVKPWQSVICHGQAHIINDELTAPEFFTGGARLIGLDTRAAKLSERSVAEFLATGAAHPPHNSEPGALSLTQINESGQLYSVEEVTALADLAHKHHLPVHMDGARFANAVAALGCSPAEISWKAGVDVLCLGATKNGALSAEAVVFFNKSLAKDFVAHRKRSGHLISKSRWLGAQFCGWLENNHWLDLAAHANQMANHLREGLNTCENAQLVWPTKANEIFAILPKAKINDLRAAGAVFYEWPKSMVPTSLLVSDQEDVVRFVTSFRTEKQEIDQFIALLQ